MRLIIYILLTIIYIFLVFAGLFNGIGWFTMIWLVYGMVYFGSKVMNLLEEKGL